jgi:four helix bundle protein
MTQFSDNKTDSYDLEERTAKFGEDVIDFVKTVEKNAINTRIISQLVGSVGSFGANYCEATEAESKKDFIHKIGICKKEIKETKHWLRLLARSNPEHKEEIRKLWKGTHELLLIFSKISRSSRQKQD